MKLPAEAIFLCQWPAVQKSSTVITFQRPCLPTFVYYLSVTGLLGC